MTKNIQALRGMSDILPAQVGLWQKLETAIRELTSSYAYQEIRTPIVESTGLFQRSIGEETDIVAKEMYTFADRNQESITLRPEGTAAVVRAGQQHGLLYNQEQRLWYAGPMFRYERPQKGRYRQFHQFGVEFYGVASADADAEVLLMSAQLWKKLGLFEHVSLEVNSIGLAAEREAYKQALIDYLTPLAERLDEDSQRRLQTNVLRILDSKNEQTQALLADAPVLSDFLTEQSQAHFARVCQLLDYAGITYRVNPRLVRGLDYYNHTVFEWVTDQLGAQSAILGGGRYDTLVEQLGGRPTPAVGFAMGVERIVLLLEQHAFGQDTVQSADIYMIALGQNAEQVSFLLAQSLRDALPYARVLQHCGGGAMKKQMKRADRSQAQFAVILGDDEIAQEQVIVKSLRGQSDQVVLAQSALVSYLETHLHENNKG